MNKTVASVIDDINEWENPRGGSVFYVTAIFTDETVGSVGRKDHDAALEVQGLLREAIGIEQDFVLDPRGLTKGGRPKFKILGFGTPGGAATYTAPGVQGGAVAATGTPVSRQRSPEQNEDIRRAVALKAAVEFCAAHGITTDAREALRYADVFEAWLARTSEPASSAYKGGDPASTVAVQAGVGSETTSPETERETAAAGVPGGTGGDLPQETRPLPADGAGLVDSGDGEAPESTPHLPKSGGDVLDPNPPAASEPGPLDHVHDYQLRQGVKGFLVCECGKTRKKETAPKT